MLQPRLHSSWQTAPTPSARWQSSWRPEVGRQLFLAGKHFFIETVIVDDRDTLARLASWMRARGKEPREAIWFRDAEAAEAIDAVLFVGLADWYPKLEPDPARPRYFITEARMGYRFELGSDASP